MMQSRTRRPLPRRGFLFVCDQASRRNSVKQLRCRECGRLREFEPAYVCEHCFGPLEVPADLEPGKGVAARAYGATVVEVNGTYDDVNRLCVELADLYGWAIVNVNLRPFYSEGSKTLAFEVVEQLGWRAPDHIVVPVAAGSLLAKTAKAFQELVGVGLVDRVATRIHAAQAEGCAPVSIAIQEGRDQVTPVLT